jgi:hypothetical protein
VFIKGGKNALAEEEDHKQKNGNARISTFNNMALLF